MSSSSRDQAHTASDGRRAPQPHATRETVLPWVTWDRPIRYGDWRIYRNDFTAHPDWLSVAWLYVHEDYDGVEDSRNGFASSIDGCIAAIQEWEEDYAA